MIYLALAPKSNAAYTRLRRGDGGGRAHRLAGAAEAYPERADPLMKSEGFGKGYVYDHDTEDGFSGQEYFPPEMPREQFYDPGARGFERELRERLLSLTAERIRRGGSGSE